MRWLGPLLDRPGLWHFDRQSVALGAALGVFFGFLIPVAQILASALLALLLRANLPVAAVSTLVSNPLTYGPIWVLAYRTGSNLLGETPDAASVAAVEREAEAEGRDPQTWAERFATIGKPLALGLAVFAIVGGAITWIAVNLLWILVARLRRRGPPG
ncbi:MAG: DUF2062 domain-containing protein [Burkholderiales bacterium]